MSAEQRRRQASEIMSGALMGVGLYAITRTVAVVYRELRRSVVTNDDLRQANKSCRSTVVDLRQVLDAMLRSHGYPADVCTSTKCRSGRPLPHMKRVGCPS